MVDAGKYTIRPMDLMGNGSGKGRRLAFLLGVGVFSGAFAATLRIQNLPFD